MNTSNHDHWDSTCGITPVVPESDNTQWIGIGDILWLSVGVLVVVYRIRLGRTWKGTLNVEHRVLQGTRRKHEMVSLVTNLVRQIHV